ncbi:hypothetical protein SLA2020_444040 [Shorea laevis]
MPLDRSQEAWIDRSLRSSQKLQISSATDLVYCFGHNSQYKIRLSKIKGVGKKTSKRTNAIYVKDQIRTSWGSKMHVKFKNFPETKISAEMKISRKISKIAADSQL